MGNISIIVCGLQGAGKTTMAELIYAALIREGLSPRSIRLQDEDEGKPVGPKSARVWITTVTTNE